MPAPSRTSLAPAVTIARLRERAAPRLPLAPLSPERYAAGHEAFEARSTQRGLIAGYLGDHLADRTGELSILSAGCGDGALDALVAARLASPDRPVAYAGLDPHPSSAACFLRALGGLPNVRASAAVGSIEELAPEPGYDVVLSVHCLYYVRDLTQAIRRLLAAVRPGGELVLVLAPRSGLNDLASLLAPPVDGRYQWWLDDLVEALAGTGLGVDRASVTGTLDLSDCLDADDQTGRSVLDFTLQARLPDVLHGPVVEHLQTLGGENLQLAHAVEVLVVRPGGAAHA